MARRQRNWALADWHWQTASELPGLGAMIDGGDWSRKLKGDGCRDGQHGPRYSTGSCGAVCATPVLGVGLIGDWRTPDGASQCNLLR